MVQDGNIMLRTFPQVEAQREEVLKMLDPLPKGSQDTAAAAIDTMIRTAMFAGYTQGASDALTPHGAEVLSRIMDGMNDDPEHKRLS